MFPLWQRRNRDVCVCRNVNPVVSRQLKISKFGPKGVRTRNADTSMETYLNDAYLVGLDHQLAKLGGDQELTLLRHCKRQTADGAAKRTYEGISALGIEPSVFLCQIVVPTALLFILLTDQKVSIGVVEASGTQETRNDIGSNLRISSHKHAFCLFKRQEGAVLMDTG